MGALAAWLSIILSLLGITVFFIRWAIWKAHGKNNFLKNFIRIYRAKPRMDTIFIVYSLLLGLIGLALLPSLPFESILVLGISLMPWILHELSDLIETALFWEDKSTTSENLNQEENK